MKKITWVKFWTRSFGLFRYYLYIDSNKLPFYKQNFGSTFHYALTVPDGKLVAYYHNKEELADMTERMFQVACKDFSTFQRFSKQIFWWVRHFIAFNHAINPTRLATFNNRRFLVLYKTWYEKYLYWQISVYFYFVLEPIVTEQLFLLLEKYLKDHGLSEKLIEYHTAIMAPEKMNIVAKEEAHALRTALLIKRHPKEKHTRIRAHWKKFLWIPCYDIKDAPYDIAYFEDRIEKLLYLSSAALEQKLVRLTNDFPKRKRNFARLQKTIHDPRLKELMQIMHWLIFYKDYRDDMRRRVGFVGKRFMTVLADHLGLTLEEVNYCSPPEVIAWLRDEKQVSIKKIRNRIPSHYVFLSTPKGTQLYTGKMVDRVVQKGLFVGRKAEEQEIIGAIGSRGIAQGPVVIVRHSSSLAKVKRGDVLMAVTTHPEYVPAMKQAVAIVTDEGGITSHAAIVAREMKKPCIVGTKTATHIFKDGDMVEVDAVKGIVRRMKE